MKILCKHAAHFFFFAVVLPFFCLSVSHFSTGHLTILSSICYRLPVMIHTWWCYFYRIFFHRILVILWKRHKKHMVIRRENVSIYPDIYIYTYFLNALLPGFSHSPFSFLFFRFLFGFSRSVDSVFHWAYNFRFQLHFLSILSVSFSISVFVVRVKFPLRSFNCSWIFLISHSTWLLVVHLYLCAVCVQRNLWRMTFLFLHRIATSVNMVYVCVFCENRKRASSLQRFSLE